MNSNDFEKWLKEKMDNLPFEANEDGWQKLEKDIQKKKKSSLLFLSPLKIAAGILLFFSAALALYFNWKQTENTSEDIAITTTNVIPPAVSQNEDSIIQNHSKTSVNRNESNIVSNPINRQKNNKHSSKSITQTAIDTTLLPKTKYENEETHWVENNNPKSNKPPDNIKNDIPNFPIYNPKENLKNDIATKNQNIDYSLYAGIGTQNIGAFQYQFGISGQIPISSKLSIDANIGFRATQLQLEQQYAVNGINVGGDINSSIPNYAEIQKNVAVQYQSQIFSIGISPSIYYRLHKKFNLNAGLYSFRNLNTQVPVDLSSNDMTSNLVNNGLIKDASTTNTWDIGLTAGMEYRLTNMVHLNVQYLQGLNHYYAQWNNNTKRSGIQMGIKVKLNK